MISFGAPAEQGSRSGPAEMLTSTSLLATNGPATRVQRARNAVLSGLKQLQAVLGVLGQCW
eukprot:205094-Alexandrium_andersonii.AAC.1